MPCRREAAAVYQVVCDGIDGESGQRVYLQLAHDVAPVGGDGVDGDEEVAGYLFVRHALDEAHDDFLLALGDGLAAFYLANHAGDAGGDVVGVQFLLQDADGGNEEHFLDVAMVAEPLLIIIYIVQGGGELVVGQSVAGQVFDDDVFQFLKLACGVAVVAGKGIDVVVGFLLALEQGLDVGEEGFFLILHVETDVVGILVVEAQDECGEAVTGGKRGFELRADGGQLVVEKVAVGGA